jgi:hypothetical protein
VNSQHRQIDTTVHTLEPVDPSLPSWRTGLGPVFVDPIGRRRRRLRWLAVAASCVGLSYMALVLASLVGGPVSPQALRSLPKPAEHRELTVPVGSPAAAEPGSVHPFPDGPVPPKNPGVRHMPAPAPPAVEAGVGRPSGVPRPSMNPSTAGPTSPRKPTPTTASPTTDRPGVGPDSDDCQDSQPLIMLVLCPIAGAG